MAQNQIFLKKEVEDSENLTKITMIIRKNTVILLLIRGFATKAWG